MARLYPHTDSAGRRYATTPLHAPGVTGSGSTLLAAARLGRRFIGMNNAPVAQGVIERRLEKRGVAWANLVTPWSAAV